MGHISSPGGCTGVKAGTAVWALCTAQVGNERESMHINVFVHPSPFCMAVFSVVLGGVLDGQFLWPFLTVILTTNLTTILTTGFNSQFLKLFFTTVFDDLP